MMGRLLRILPLLVAAIFTVPHAQADDLQNNKAHEAGMRLGIQGISATLGEDDPRILFILPWQPPSLPRRPRAELDDHAPSLEQPVDPLALGNHRRFRESLDPMTLNPQGIQP